MNGGATVFVIDEDASSRQATCAVAESLGLTTLSFSDADEFLEESRGACRGCLVLDLPHNGTRYAQFIDEMVDRQITLPTIVVAAHPQTPLTVQLMKRGAVTVLESPIREDDLHDAIEEAIQVSETSRAQRVKRQAVLGRIASLNDNERKVMKLMIAGLANKVIAKRLKVSVRTVESRRHQVFAKMKVKSIAELVRAVVTSMT